jgi:hypothetical protein
METKQKHMTHIRNILIAIEDKGYGVLSARWIDGHIEIIVDCPHCVGERAFLEKVLDEINKAS